MKTHTQTNKQTNTQPNVVSNKQVRFVTDSATKLNI
jgi:hypothetical protein